MTVFHGAPFQRGYGIGSFFTSAGRVALPWVQKGLKTIGRAALNTGMNIAQDVLMGQNLKNSTQSRIQQTARTLKEQALNRLTPQTGRGKKRLKRKQPQKKISSTQGSKGKRAKTVTPKRKQKKRKLPSSQGQVKKSKVTHLEDIFN